MCIHDKPTSEEVTLITYRAIFSVICETSLASSPKMNINLVIFHHRTAMRWGINTEKLIQISIQFASHYIIWYLIYSLGQEQVVMKEEVLPIILSFSNTDHKHPCAHASYIYYLYI